MIFFFYGPNSYALREQANQMVEKYLATTGSDLELERIDGAMAKAENIRASLTAVPFLASSRLVIIESISTNKALAPKLTEIMDGVPKTTVVIFVEPNVDQRTVAFKTLMKSDKVVKFEPLNRSQLMAWVEQEVARLGGKADRKVLNELIDRTGDDQWRLSGELIKLINYDSTISSDSIKLLVAAGFEQDIFVLVESMTSGRPDVALGVYRGLLGKREDPLRILNMIQWQLRNLLLAKTAGNLSQSELAKAAGMSPYVAGKMISAQRRFDQRVLETAYKVAIDTEYDIKSGKQKIVAAAVEQLVYRVAMATKR